MPKRPPDQVLFEKVLEFWCWAFGLCSPPSACAPSNGDRNMGELQNVIKYNRESPKLTAEELLVLSTNR